METKGFPAIVNEIHTVLIYYTTSSVSSVSMAGGMNGWNPNRVSGGFGSNSELVMSKFVQPVEIIG